jgi:GT2 family glycosyltransferase
VAQTSVKNQKFEENDLKTLFEHSKYDFSKKNMVKCLPGPMPLWKRSIHEKCGFFDENKLNYADDWDMWLRSVANGCKFKKIDDIVGIYLEGGRSQQNSIKQRKEEAELFFKYGYMFGKNYDIYKSYFQQFI